MNTIPVSSDCPGKEVMNSSNQLKSIRSRRDKKSSTARNSRRQYYRSLSRPISGKDRISSSSLTIVNPNPLRPLTSPLFSNFRKVSPLRSSSTNNDHQPSNLHQQNAPLGYAARPISSCASSDSGLAQSGIFHMVKSLNPSSSHLNTLSSSFSPPPFTSDLSAFRPVKKVKREQGITMEKNISHHLKPIATSTLLSKDINSDTICDTNQEPVLDTRTVSVLRPLRPLLVTPHCIHSKDKKDKDKSILFARKPLQRMVSHETNQIYRGGNFNNEDSFVSPSSSQDVPSLNRPTPTRHKRTRSNSISSQESRSISALEADREVFETNIYGPRWRQHQLQQTGSRCTISSKKCLNLILNDSEHSLAKHDDEGGKKMGNNIHDHEFTAVSRTSGSHISPIESNICCSSTPIREGANLAVDRWFNSARHRITPPLNERHDDPIGEFDDLRICNEVKEKLRLIPH